MKKTYTIHPTATASRNKREVFHVVFQSKKGYVVEKHTIEDVFVSDDPLKAEKFIEACGGNS